MRWDLTWAVVVACLATALPASDNHNWSIKSSRNGDGIPTDDGLRRAAESQPALAAISARPPPDTSPAHAGHNHAPTPPPSPLPTATATELALTSKEHSRPKYRWSFDTSIAYHNWDRISAEKGLEINDRPNGHIHGIIDEYTLSQRVGFAVRNDLEIGVTQGFRHLRQINVDDPLELGRHEVTEGITDLNFDINWRFKSQRAEGFPVNLSLFASVKPPTFGETEDRTPSEELFDAENQPGTGSWDGSLGMSVSKRWGEWGASASIGYSLKGEGAQDYKAGDSLNASVGASRQLVPEHWGWTADLSLGAQFHNEFKGKDKGEIDRNHGGQFMSLVPGIAVRPIDLLTLNLSVPVPVYQDHNGTHQDQDFSVIFGTSVRF